MNLIISLHVCICWRDSPVELIDVLYVSKQGTHLLRANGEMTNINDVSQIVLENRKKQALKCRSFRISNY